MIYSQLEIIDLFDTNHKCEKYLTKLIWSSQKISPWGGQVGTKYHKSDKYKYTIYYCLSQRKEFSILKFTPLNSTRIPLPIWFNIFYDSKVELAQSGKLPSERTIERTYKVSSKTSYQIRRKLKECTNSHWWEKLFEI